MRSIKEARIKRGERVLLRSDFDVGLKEKKILDDFRIKRALLTIKFLIKKKARLIIISHLGRPKGRFVKELSLDPIAEYLNKSLKKPILKLNQLLGEKVKKTIEKLKPGEILLLENLRFYPEEEENDLEFAKKLAELGKIFVNDAFATSHRNHASIVGIPCFLPSFAGLQLEKEVLALKKALGAKKDLVVILGGAKTETKIPVIEALVKKGAIVLLGGIVANTFLAAYLGREKVDSSAVDEERIDLARAFLRQLDTPTSFSKIPGKTTRIWLPLDIVVGRPKDGDYEKIKEISFFPHEESVPKGREILDIGSKTIAEYSLLVSFAKAIIFNGPLGKIEDERFQRGTKKVMESVSNSPAFSIVGGGETIAALEKFGLTDKIDLVSTGGGAMLEFLAKGTLPGIEALK